MVCNMKSCRSAAVIVQLLWSHCQVRFTSSLTSEGLFAFDLPRSNSPPDVSDPFGFESLHKGCPCFSLGCHCICFLAFPRLPIPIYFPCPLLLLLCTTLLLRIQFVLCLAPACSLPVAVDFPSNR